MRETRIHGAFECSAPSFWNEVFFREDFGQFVYLKGLGFTRWTLEDASEKDGLLHREVRLAKPLSKSVPRGLRAIAGDELAYVERGVFDPQRGRYEMTLTAERSLPGEVRGIVTVEPHPVGCLRTVHLTANIRLPGIGGRIEKALVEGFAEGYSAAVEHGNRFIRDHGLVHTQSKPATEPPKPVDSPAAPRAQPRTL